MALAREGDDFLDAIVVDQVMTAKPHTVPPDAVLDIADMFLDERMGAIPVVSADDKLLGIISYIDVIGHFVGRRTSG